ncbi:TPA: hypothetical protein OTQ31_001617 [Citrobacter koseri]|nr:hypothetical protein [Citrobacter koseri]
MRLKNLQCSLPFDLVYFAPIFCGIFVVISSNKIFNLSLTDIILYVSSFVIAISLYVRIAIGASTKCKLGYNSLFVFAISILIITYALSFYDSNMNKYFSFNPIFDVDNYNIWHKDSAYNLAIIQSIINFGYPSIGLDGHALTTYHVLSHYVDALLLKISGLPIYESYGFSSYVKAVFLICSIYVFCYQYSKNIISSSVAFLFISPFIVASWHAINSHALWLPSFILVFSARFTFNFLYQSEVPTFKKYNIIAIISALLCLGKISTGLAYITIVFSVAFIRDLKSLKFYFYAVTLLLFIVFYQKVINYSYGIPAVLELQALSPTVIYHHLLNTDIRYEKFFIPFIAAIILLRICIKSEFLTRLIFGVICSFSSIFVITQTFTSFNWSDKYYFFQGLYSVTVLLFCSYILTWANASKEEKKIKHLTSFALISLLSFFVYQPVYSIASINAKSIVSKFEYVKIKLFKPHKTDVNGSMYSLKQYVYQIKEGSHLNNRDIALFIPKSVILNQVIKINDGNKNFHTMNIYAATGIQIINGLIGNERAYGLINYGKQSALKESIDYSYECSRLGVKAIITVENYTEKKYLYHLCDGQ